MVLLSGIERAMSQLLIAHGTIEDSKLANLIKSVREDFAKERVRPIKESFERINLKLRPLSMEIKSVVRSRCTACEVITNIRAPTCDACSSPLGKHEWVYFHGIVNTEEDAVSKDQGSEFNQEEIKFFSDLIQKLLEKRYLSTDDVYRIKHVNWTAGNTDVVLEKLRVKGWLQRDERSFWEIGVRTYMELRSFIEGTIRSLEADSDDDAAAHAKNIAEQIARLPQITTY